MKVLKITSLFCLILLASACSSSKKIAYNSKWNAPFNYVDEVKPDQQDQQSRLAYGIINDAQFIYLTVKTKDPNTIQRILGNGLRVSFSPEGQKKNSYYLQFPVVLKEDKKALRKVDTDLPNSLGLSFLLDSYNKEALWKDKSGQHFINLVESKGSISSVISMDKNNELTEQIIIPLSLLEIDINKTNYLGVNIKLEGSSSGSGLSPRIGFGLSGGIGMGSGVGFGSGNGYNNSYNDKGVDIRLEVQLAKDIF